MEPRRSGRATKQRTDLVGVSWDEVDRRLLSARTMTRADSDSGEATESDAGSGVDSDGDNQIEDQSDREEGGEEMEVGEEEPESKRRARPAARVKSTKPKKAAQSKARRAVQSLASANGDEDQSDIEDAGVDHESTSALWEDMMRPHGALKVAVSNLIRAIGNDAGDARCQLINAIFRTAEASAQITQAEMEDIDPNKLVKKIGRQTKEDPPGPEVRKSSPRWLKTLLEFFPKLVAALHSNESLYRENCALSGPLVDDELVAQHKTIISHTIEWLVEISHSEIRTFRQVATESAYALQSGIIDALKSLMRRSEEIAIHLESDAPASNGGSPAAKSRGPRKALDQAHLRALQSEQKRVALQLKILESLAQQVVEGVFAHRYRDSVTSIRSTSIEAFGQWIAALPEYYLKDNYLKYIGWTLSDKEPEVRSAALDALTALLADDTNRAGLSNFCNRFLDRVMEMTRDIDSDIAAAAIHLSVEYLKLGWLSQDDGGHIASLMFDHANVVQQAAGHFVFEDAFAADETGKAPSPMQQVGILLEVLLEASPAETELEVAARSIVLALWDYLPILQDWELLTRTLRESGEGAQSNAASLILDDKKQTHLAFVLLAAAEHCNPAALDLADPQLVRTREPKLGSEAQAKIVTMSQCLITELPALLNVFQADVQKLIALLQLPRCIDLSVYVARRQAAMLEALLSALRVVYLKHADAPVLTAASRVIAHLANTVHDMQDEAQSAARQIAVAVGKHAQQAVDALVKAKDDDNLDDLELEVCVALKRVAILAARLEFSELDYSESMDSMFLLQLRIVSDTGLVGGHPDILALCLELAVISITWRLFKARSDSRAQQSATQMKDLRSRVSRLSESLQVLLAQGEGTLLFKAFQCSADLLQQFASRIEVPGVDTESLLGPLRHELCETSSVLLRDLVAAVSESSNDSASRIYLDTLLSIVGKLISYDFDCFKQLVPTFLDVPRLVQDENTDVLVRTVLGNLKRVGHDTVMEAFSLTFLHMYDAANATAGADDNARSVLLPDNEWVAIRETSKRLAMSLGVGQAKGSLAALFENVIHHVFADAADAPGEVPLRLPLLDAALGPFVGRASTSDLGVALKCIIGHKGRLPAGIELRTADRESWSFLSDFQEMIKSAIHGDKRGAKRVPGSAFSARSSASMLRAASPALSEHVYKQLPSSVVNTPSRQRLPLGVDQSPPRLGTPSRSRSPFVGRSRSPALSVVALGKRKGPSVGEVHDDSQEHSQKVSKPSRFHSVAESEEQPEPIEEFDDEETDLALLRKASSRFQASQRPQVEEIEESSQPLISAVPAARRQRR